MSLVRKTICLIALSACAIALSSCGGSANNENGVVLTNLGYFLLPEGTVGCEDDLPTPVLGLTLPIGEVSSETLGTDGAIILAVGYQSNLTGQTVRIEATELSYFIPGASIQPPSTIVASPLLLGPLDAGEGASVFPTDSSLPPGFSSVCNRGFGEIQVIPPAVRAFISLNRGSFPEPPFEMFVSARGSGITSGGNRIYTPEVTMGITITPETVIPPTIDVVNEG
ncbi:MAG: hypothetical protein KDD64_01125 [Bdellovibrionales bacterium]|nr:hypothetical protein [Bdellovibrionales bacterium]